MTRQHGFGEIEERAGKFRVRLRYEGARTTLGSFDSLEKAEAAVTRARQRLDRQISRRLCVVGSLEHAYTLPPAPRDIYGIWLQMLARCYDTRHDSWRNYGGRGIEVCLEWQSALGSRVFYAHIGPRPSVDHTVDRIDNDRGYEPGNVRWATPAQQAANKRRAPRPHNAPIAPGAFLGRTAQVVDFAEE